MHIKNNCKEECWYGSNNPGCSVGGCKTCKLVYKEDGSWMYRCRCLTIKDGDPCPYFKPLHPTEHTEETDYEEMLRTLF